MKKIIILFVIMGMALWVQARVIRVPVGASFSDGGVRAVPDSLRASFYGATDSDTLIKSIKYVSDSLSTDSTLRTITYCTTSSPGVMIKYDIYYASGTKDRVYDYYEPQAKGNDPTSIYRMYVGIIDTSATPDDTTMTNAAKVTFRYGSSGDDHQSIFTNSYGYADFNVTLKGLYSVTVEKAGATFTRENLLIDSVVDFSGTVVGYNFLDTIYGYGVYSSSKCYVSLNLNDFGYDYVEGVKVVASVKKRWNSCTNTWFALNEQVMGYTNSSGYLEFELPRSSCIDDSKIRITTSYGNNQDSKLGDFTIPDSTTYVLVKQ